ncbi:Mitotic spindle-associated MMXD complex subunit MIP18 [Araneus ventricosus]|uniref:Mitotic spindle-associated MMXD complex subunit MIP18 n=1 Tax=Araneus ventricosus TaxID=182803 RepID=A0A4Y2JEU5_ARAVE|nr:Mitotic spindle-associated MMXD complex subunit MIP18 [Araneus ventricosus]
MRAEEGRLAPRSSRWEVEGVLATQRCMTSIRLVRVKIVLLWVPTRISLHVHVISLQNIVNDENGEEKESGTVCGFHVDIKDPEHPMTLEELRVVELSSIEVDDKANYCHVQFTPTIPNCSMATLIGLAIKVQLLRLMPARFKIDVTITPGTHNSADAVNKQLGDKERVTAALENLHLHAVINECLLFPEPQFIPRFVERALEESNKLEHQKVRYIQHSRQHIESYRRWRDIIYGNEKKWKSSLVYNV